jgi:hypothetical protein
MDGSMNGKRHMQSIRWTGPTRASMRMISVPFPQFRMLLICIFLFSAVPLLTGCGSRQQPVVQPASRLVPDPTSQPTVGQAGDGIGGTPDRTPVTSRPTEIAATAIPGVADRILDTAVASETPNPPGPVSTSLTPLTPTITLSPTPTPLVPPFPHIFVFILENKEFGTVIGQGRGMPNYNLWASEYTLLTEFYAIRHPSLPNYLALIGGDTFGVDTNCNGCYQDALTLPDLIEASGRSWKGYFEDMPEPCFAGDTHLYVQKHNPFMYFDSIRLDAARCQRSVVPLTQLNADLAANDLPDFALIVPNLCNDAHDCGVDVADTWLDHWVLPLMRTPAYAEGGLIVLTWDEGQGEHTCCGLTTGGGRIATILISPWVKRGFEDDTPYTHYSLLKTIAEAWGLPYLGHAADESNLLIVKPWER